MSQEYNSNKRARRISRSQRNKPVLVTPSGNEVAIDETGEQSEASLQEITPVIEEPTSLVVPTPAPTESRRLPRFFSNVRKSEQDAVTKEIKENNVAQARLARATRGKTTTEVPATTPAVKNKVTTGSKTTNAARPVPNRANTAQPSLFKTRYIIGMGVYLLGANFLGIYETQFLRSIGLDSELGRFNLFGGVIDIRTSTLLFLATLVIILILLARFDLIPRSFSSVASRQPQRSGQRQLQNETTQGEKVLPPTIRQGVKGSDDRLYQEYRTKQRREKKR